MNSRGFLSLFTVLFSLPFALAGCAGCGPLDGSDTGVASLELHVEEPPPDAGASCAQEGDACNCPRSTGTIITLMGFNQEGAEVGLDTSLIEWHVDGDSSAISTNESGAQMLVSAWHDWFDNGGAEGGATLRAEYGGLSTSMPINVVIDAGGSWLATLDRGFTYPLSLRQSGRAVVDTGTGYTGRVVDNTLTLNVSGIAVNATFTSRTEVSGTYSSGASGLNGTLTCTKQ